MKAAGGNLGRHEADQQHCDDRRSHQIPQTYRHAQRIAARLAERRRQHLDEPKAEGDSRNFAGNRCAIILHPVVLFCINGTCVRLRM